MSEELAGWPRKYYQRPAGRPFLFYVVYGTFSQMPALSRQDYRSNGEYTSLQLSHYDRGKHPDVLDQFRQGYVWNDFKRQEPDLTESVQAAGECLIRRGELDDQTDLNYLRDTVGLLTFLLDHGGIAIYEPQM